MKKRDTRSAEMKKILKKKFPDYVFKVKTNKYSMGESFNVYTDMLPEHPGRKVNKSYHDLEGIDRLEFDLFTEERQRIEKMIKELVGHHESIDRCPMTGEILSGGNTFMFIERLQK
jgi:hypothetical protein